MQHGPLPKRVYQGLLRPRALSGPARATPRAPADKDEAFGIARLSDTASHASHTSTSSPASQSLTSRFSDDPSPVSVHVTVSMYAVGAHVSIYQVCDKPASPIQIGLRVELYTADGIYTGISRIVSHARAPEQNSIDFVLQSRHPREAHLILSTSSKSGWAKMPTWHHALHLFFASRLPITYIAPTVLPKLPSSPKVAVPSPTRPSLHTSWVTSHTHQQFCKRQIPSRPLTSSNVHSPDDSV